MPGYDLIVIIGSPTGVMLAAQIATLLFVLAGLFFMIGWRRIAKRLIVLAVVVIVVPFVVAAHLNEIRSLMNATPAWVAAPLLAFVGIVVFCWILWGVIALCFGPTIASFVTADILAWLIKRLIVPFRGVSGTLRRIIPPNSSD